MSEKLSLIYDKRMNDFVVRFPDKRDGHFVMHKLTGDVLEHSFDEPYEKTNFIKDLERRGYDPKTLKFSIEKKI